MCFVYSPARTWIGYFLVICSLFLQFILRNHPPRLQAGGAAEDQSRRSESITGNQQALHFGNCRARSATLTNLLSNKVQSAVCSAQVGEHESREENSDQLTSFIPGKVTQIP